MLRYWKIWWRVVRMSMMQDMMYGWDFIMSIVTGGMMLITQFLTIKMLFFASGSSNVAGFSENDLYLMMIYSQLVTGIVFWLVPARVLRLVARQINEGGLDYYIVKPINLFYAIFSQRVSFREITSVWTFALIALPVIIQKVNFDWSWERIFLLIIISMVSMVILVSLYLIGTLVSFYWEKFEFMSYFDSLLSICRMPKNIYPTWLIWILTFVLPLLLVVNPAFGLLNNTIVIDGLSQMILAMFVLVGMVILLWSNGLKRYQSAG